MYVQYNWKTMGMKYGTKWNKRASNILILNKKRTSLKFAYLLESEQQVSYATIK